MPDQQGPVENPHRYTLNSIAHSIESAFPSAAEDLRNIAGAMQKDPVWPNQPVHMIVPLCMKQREIDGRRCSMPATHPSGFSGEENHYYSIVLDD